MRATAAVFALLIAQAALAQDQPGGEELCQRGAVIVVEGFKKENPNLPPDYFHLENVKLAFPTTDGVICQADFVFSDPRIAPRNQPFPVKPAADGKIQVCNRQGKCTDPQ